MEIKESDVDRMYWDEDESWATVLGGQTEEEAIECKKQILDNQKRLENIGKFALLTKSLVRGNDLKEGMQHVLTLLEEELK